MASAGAAGLVAATAYPPLDLGVTVFVGMIALLWLWRDASPGQAAAYGFVWGFVFFAATMSWIYYFGAIAFLPLMSVLAAFVALIGFVVGLLGHAGVRSAWVTAAVWTIIEAIRGRFPLGGLPWADIGVGLAGFAPARDLARWGGTPLVTFLVVLLAGLVVTIAGSLTRRSRRSTAIAVGSGAGILAIGAVTALAVATASLGPPAGELRFALLQGNDLNRDLTPRELADRYLPASHFTLADRLAGQYDLIVFPESSMDRDPREDTYLTDEIHRVARDHDAFVLVNAGVEDADGRSYNANLLYGPDGRLVGTYAKQRLVPFGEYVPFEEWLSWIPATDQIATDYTAGDDTVIFDVEGIPLATIICFENAFSGVTRDAVRDGAEVIVVTTNNRSYRRSANAAQHVALSQMRAAETGRPVLHAAISGITAVVGPDGSVSEQSELFVNGVTEGTVVARRGETPYVRYGDWMLAVCAVAVLAAVAVAFRRRAETAQDVPVDSPV